MGGGVQSGAPPLPDKKGSVTVVYTNTRSEATKPYPAGKVWMGVGQSGESPLPDKKGSVMVVYTNTRSEATKPYHAGKVWMGVVQSGESPLPDKKGSVMEPFLSGRGDSNTRPLRPERSALANCATSRNFHMYLTKRGLLSGRPLLSG